MIRVTIPEDQLPERKYALHVILSEYLDLTFSSATDRSCRDYILEYDGRRLIIEDGFFSKHSEPLSYLSQRFVPETTKTCRAPGLENQILIYGRDVLQKSDDGILCGLDIFGGAFFMLTRWEEAVVDQRDEHGRFPAAAALAYRAQFLFRPIVNEYTALIRRLLTEIGVPQEAFKDSEAKTILTVDADHPVYWSSFPRALLKILSAGVKSRSPVASMLEMRRYVARLRGDRDPYDTFDLLADIAEACNSDLYFFFMAGGKNVYDSRLTVRHPQVRQICQRILDRGYHIGFHPSYDAAVDQDVFNREVSTFTISLGIPVECGRQHYLRFRVPETWRSWEKCGAEWESTMGYAEAPGFRCGTCKSFPVFDVKERRMLALYERPFTLMDVTLHNYMSLDPDAAVATGRKLRQQTEAHNGEFVVLWHNSSFFTPDWQGYENVLGRILE